jgi:hypothetical protein
MLLVAGVQTTVAGLRGKSPFSWTKTSSNGKFIFAAIPEETIEDEFKMVDENENWDDAKREAEKGRITDIRQRYPDSGMYTNDVSKTLLWKYDSWWIDRGFPSLDGQQFVVIGEGAYGNISHFDIIHIYDRNGLVRTLYEEDFVPLLEMFDRRYLSDWNGWPPTHDIRLDPRGKLLTIKSDLGDIVQISLQDGRVVDRKLAPNSIAAQSANRVRSIIWALTLAFAVSLAWLAIRIGSRNRRRMKAQIT